MNFRNKRLQKGEKIGVGEFRKKRFQKGGKTQIEEFRKNAGWKGRIRKVGEGMGIRKQKLRKDRKMEKEIQEGEKHRKKQNQKG